MAAPAERRFRTPQHCRVGQEDFSAVVNNPLNPLNENGVWDIITNRYEENDTEGTMKKRLLSLVLALALVLTMLPVFSVEAMAATINDENVFLKQEVSGECTLISATMMLRRRAIIDGNANWKSITKDDVAKTAWVSDGLRYSFSYMGMDVNHEKATGSLADKKARLIELLSKHPEGIEIYDDGIPHAVLVTDYDSATGTFYCADPAPSISAGRIKLSESLNARNSGRTQDGVINNIYKYWYITNKNGGGPGLVTVTFNANGGKCSVTSDYVTPSGTLSSLPTATRGGYIFLGWYTAPSGGRKVDTTTKFSGDTTVYAQWKEVGGSCGDNASWSYNDENGILKITGSGDMSDWSAVSGREAPWYEYRGTIKQVEIGTGIKNIGDYAFRGLTKLVSVNIQAELQKIGSGAFENCTSLTSLEGIEGVQIIGGSAFRNCSALAEIGIPDGCVNVGSYAFSGTAVKSIHVPASTRALGEGAFSGCKALTYAELPSGLLTLKSGSFSGCTSLAAVIFYGDDSYGGAETLIESDAFSGCTALSELSIYSRAESLRIAQNALRGCVNIKSVSLDCRSLCLENNAFPSGAGINYVMISGEYGSVADKAFEGVSANIVYPQNGTQWNSKVGSNYGGSLTWEGYDNHVHSYTAAVTEPTCSERGCTTYTCSGCGESFVDSYVAMLGHHFEDGVCTRCGRENPFNDIKAEDAHKPFTDAILWAAEEKISTGYSDGSFRPDASCTRAQVVTFLWRAAGSPEPESRTNPFSDVSGEGDLKPYYKAILWAVEQGITSGVTKTEFAPNSPCSRAQFVTFLWRYMDKPANSGINPFSDVTANNYYQAILWAYESAVTTGYADGTFRPNSVCSRAQVVTFIYRAVAEK